nr:CLL_HP1_G0047250.mRNA.1.CDS.1 [Saccharomyces cerevisiae]
MKAQDCLYTLVERGIKDTNAYIVGSITAYMYAPDDPRAVIEKMANPDTHIVSLTVTENGYYHSEATNSLMTDAPEIINDLNHPEKPDTLYGYLYEALFMVDRVTPRCTDKERKYVADTWGIKDQCPVVAEPFIQWVLEDNFSDGRPPWELVGVQVVKDVDSYELMKLRLLNGGHSAMGYLGYLAGYTYIHEVVNDPTINNVGKILNPAIQDTVARICLMGSGKMPKYVLPSIYEQLRKPDGKYKLLAVCVAGWFRYLTGVDMNGKPFEIEDPMAATLKAAAVKGGKDPHELLNIEVLFSPEIRDNKEFVAQLTHSPRNSLR